MILGAVSKTISEPVQAILKNSWRTMGRAPEIDYKLYGDATAVTAVVVESEYAASDLRDYLRAVHEYNRRDFWRGNSGPEHDVPYESLDDGMKVNYLTLLHAYKSGTSINSSPLPEEIDRVNYNFVHIGAIKTTSSIFQPGAHTPERFVLVNQKIAWENRENLVPLMWGDTAVATIQAIKENVTSLDKAKDEMKFKKICQRLHELMVENKLWGNDSFNTDRVHFPDESTFPEPKPFNDLPIHLKEDYVLLVLSGLSGLGDYMRKLREAAEQRATA